MASRLPPPALEAGGSPCPGPGPSPRVSNGGGWGQLMDPARRAFAGRSSWRPRGHPAGGRGPGEPWRARLRKLEGGHLTLEGRARGAPKPRLIRHSSALQSARAPPGARQHTVQSTGRVGAGGRKGREYGCPTTQSRGEGAQPGPWGAANPSAELLPQGINCLRAWACPRPGHPPAGSFGELWFLSEPETPGPEGACLCPQHQVRGHDTASP